jgi:hypothetical protein
MTGRIAERDYAHQTWLYSVGVIGDMAVTFAAWLLFANDPVVANLGALVVGVVGLVLYVYMVYDFCAPRIYRDDP